MTDCTKAADCTARTHWFDCLAGRAQWRADHHSTTPEGARDAERIRALQTNDYVEPPNPRDEVDWGNP